MKGVTFGPSQLLAGNHATLEIVFTSRPDIKPCSKESSRLFIIKNHIYDKSEEIKMGNIVLIFIK